MRPYFFLNLSPYFQFYREHSFQQTFLQSKISDVWTARSTLNQNVKQNYNQLYLKVRPLITKLFTNKIQGFLFHKTDLRLKIFYFGLKIVFCLVQFCVFKLDRCILYVEKITCKSNKIHMRLMMWHICHQELGDVYVSPTGKAIPSMQEPMCYLKPN